MPRNAAPADSASDREATLALLRILDWKPWFGMNTANIADSIERRKAVLEGLTATKGDAYGELLGEMRRFLGYAERDNASGNVGEAFGWIESFDRYRRWVDGGSKQ